MFRATHQTPRLAHERVTVRHAHADDARALNRLAALDSAHTPGFPTLVAESDARIVAALPLGCGRPIADPFEPSAELVALLELRAAQLRAGDGDRRRGIGERIRSLRHRRPAAA
jgi:hypothetical protein